LDTHEFLTTLYQGGAGWFTISYINNGNFTSKPYRTVDNGVKAAELLTKQGKDVWMSVGMQSKKPAGGRGGKRDVTSIPGFWCDIDMAGPGHKTDKPLPSTLDQALGLISWPEPSWVVSTGGGIHAYWLFTEPWQFEAGDDEPAKMAEAWHRMIADNGRWHVDNVADLARVLRLPGTFNHKTGEPVPVEVIRHSGVRYQRDYLAGLVELRSSASKDAGSDLDTGWAQETIGKNGWTLCHGEEWTRPGKVCKEGASATVHPYGMYVHSDAADLDHGWHTPQEVASFYGVPLTEAKRGPLGLVLDSSELDTLPEVEPLIEDVISLRSAVVMVGEYGVGKSFAALGMAASVATGRPWLGRKVEQAPVLYVVGEGSYGLSKRLAAWREAFNDGEPIPKGAFTVSIRPDSLLNPSTWEAITKEAQRSGARFVVLDTLSALTPDADETKDAPKLIRSLVDLSATIDGTALFLHHPGWLNKKRSRGGSQLESNVDEVLLLEELADNLYGLRRKKVKDGPDGGVVFLQRRQVAQSLIIEESTDVPQSARQTELLNDLKSLCDHGLLNLTQRAAISKARELHLGLGKHRIETAMRAWKTVDDVTRLAEFSDIACS